MYDGYAYSSSGSTLTVKGVQIGKAEWTGVVPGNKSHIAGEASPMYGLKSGLSKNVSPDIRMKHLAAVVGIKVWNTTDGPIKVKDVEISVPQVVNSTGAVTQTEFPLAGYFDVTITPNENVDPTLEFSVPTTLGDGEFSSSSVKVALESEVEISKGGSLTFYAPVRPFSEKKTISIKVNCSERVSSKSVALEAGKVTIFTVPVMALEKETASDIAFNVTTKGRETSDGTGAEVKAITTTGKQQTVVVNGKEVKAYKLCGDSNNTITVTGFIPGLFTKLPVGFFATGWNDEPSVMTVTNVKAWLPEFDTEESYETKEETNNRNKYTGKGTTYKKQLYSINQDFNQILGRKNTMTLSLLWGSIEKEITLDISRQMMTLLGEGVKSKITFSGMPPVGYFTGSSSADDTNTSHNVITLNEDYAHKSINETNIDGFIKQLSKNASYEGLKQILTATEDKGLPMTYSNKIYIETTTTYSSYLDSGTASVTTTPYDEDYSWPESFQQNYPEAIKTAEAIYKLLSSKSMDFGIAEIKLAGDGGLIPNKVALIHFLRDMKVSLTLGTMGETEDSKTNTTAVIWGLDVNAEE